MSIKYKCHQLYRYTCVLKFKCTFQYNPRLCIMFMILHWWLMGFNTTVGMCFVFFLACVFLYFICVTNVVWYDSCIYSDFYVYELLVNFSFLHLYRNIILNVFCSSHTLILFAKCCAACFSAIIVLNNLAEYFHLVKWLVRCSFNTFKTG